ncbi:MULTISPECIES: flavodoxin family protein [unclassified Saccharopolyspora]|uniref:flavodoxin family protein n=1 Tax=unclassified Saccharopolyspora TaxID=2646250 RepID=UPI001CD49DCC|nr:MULTISPECIES: flavodoxin family protein [unclassified Saccharopolyspora]MCA1186732.1 flavodoxin family protein [Saccharopolyspora sp. 6T]MCA1226606.1 flavodoxin family protein [Saccharopolyspora sp. 6M]
MESKNVIVCTSVSHGGTRRIAEAMAGVLDAEVVPPQRADPDLLARADLVGFGSGVFHGRMHADLLGLARALPRGRGSAFAFATSGFPEFPLLPFTRPLARSLAGAGLAVRGTFTCRAWDTWGPFGLVGGLHRRRPDERDLAAAREFAGRMRRAVG